MSGQSTATADAYRRDVSGFLGFLNRHRGAPQGVPGLGTVTLGEMRAWMAHERRRGLGARSLARALSAVKSFYRWLGETEGIEVSAVLATRSPKYKKPLPRPLKPAEARRVLDTVELQAPEPWVALRDVAVVTLLYGAGLRISEALGLT
ncbi:MAG: site-specific integrase, partial [Pseudomonadota bacterium]